MHGFIAYIFVSICILLPTASHSKKWSEIEVIATGKNIITMAGFYKKCGEKDIIQIKGKVLRWSGFMGQKYLAIAGLENEYYQLYELGMRGYLIKDPAVSDSMFITDFSKDSCALVKSLLETNSNLVEALFYERGQ